MNERRKTPRLRVNLPSEWEHGGTRHADTIVDISRTGCFMLTGGRVRPLEPVLFRIKLPSNETITVLAEVVDFASEIGFAARFTYMEVRDQVLLKQFIEERLAAEGTQ